MENPFLEITTRLDALAVDVRAIKIRTTTERPPDELIDLDTFCREFRYAKRTAYKLCHFKKVPYFKIGNRLWFRRSELAQWIDAGRRRTVAEVAVERMTGNK